MPRSDAQMVEATKKIAMEYLDKLNLALPEAGHAIAIEQVRATYVLATVLASLQTDVSNISNDLPMAGRGH